MAVYKIDWKSAAYHELKNLARPVISRVLRTVEILVHDPIPPGARKLHGAERTYRVRMGDYRIIYELALPEQVVTIMRVRHRKDAYR
jgi:mRNA interferase RelE/StbE